MITKNTFYKIMLIALLFTNYNSFSQNQLNASVLFVNTKSGLKLRENPSIKGVVINIVKYGESVELIDAEKEVTETIDHVNGKWVKVKFKDEIGFMFDGYLSIFPRPNTINLEIKKVEIPIYCLHHYFNLVLSIEGKKIIKTIKPCGSNPDCQYGVFEHKYKMKEGFELIETHAWDTYDIRIIGESWSFLDAVDIVDSIFKLTETDDFEIKKDKNFQLYLHPDYTVIISKLTGNLISVRWETTH